MSERATRKGSYWTRKVPAHDGGDLVRIVAGRRRIGDDRWAPVAGSATTGGRPSP